MEPTTIEGMTMPQNYRRRLRRRDKIRLKRRVLHLVQLSWNLMSHTLTLGHRMVDAAIESLVNALPALTTALPWFFMRGSVAGEVTGSESSPYDHTLRMRNGSQITYHREPEGGVRASEVVFDEARYIEDRLFERHEYHDDFFDVVAGIDWGADGSTPVVIGHVEDHVLTVEERTQVERMLVTIGERPLPWDEILCHGDGGDPNIRGLLSECPHHDDQGHRHRRCFGCKRDMWYDEAWYANGARGEPLTRARFDAVWDDPLFEILCCACYRKEERKNERRSIG